MSSVSAGSMRVACRRAFLFAERRQLAHGVVVQGDPERPSVAIK